MKTASEKVSDMEGGDKEMEQDTKEHMDKQNRRRSNKGNAIEEK